MAYDIASAEVNDQLFSGLLSLSFDGNLVPEAAFSWDILDDGHRYLFKLQEDLRWSDGTPVTAMDFEFAWKTCFESRHWFPNGIYALLHTRGNGIQPGDIQRLLIRLASM